jgi:hypothetical protein
LGFRRVQEAGGFSTHTGVQLLFHVPDFKKRYLEGGERGKEERGYVF